MQSWPAVLVKREVRAGAIAVALTVALTLGLVAALEPAAVLAVAILWAVVLVPIAFYAGPWRVAIDGDGIAVVGPWRRRLRWSEVDRIVAGTALGERVVALVPRSRWRRRTNLHFLRWGPPLLDALRRHAPPGTYRITLADEQVLLGAALPETLARRDRSRASVARAAAYRESAGAGTSISLDRRLPVEQRHVDQVWIRGGLGAALFAVAAVTEDGTRALVIALVFATFLWAARAARRAHRHTLERTRIRQWLGGAARVDVRGMLTSEDGRRRLRQLRADLEDPWMGVHYHLEQLDVGGATLVSTPYLGPDLGLPAEMRAASARELAPVRSVRGGRAVAYVVLDHGPDGALLHRFDDRGRTVGDTFHEDAAEARAYVAPDLELGPWEEIDPRADAWSLARIGSAGRAGADVL